MKKEKFILYQIKYLIDSDFSKKPQKFRTFISNFPNRFLIKTISLIFVLFIILLSNPILLYKVFIKICLVIPISALDNAFIKHILSIIFKLSSIWVTDMKLVLFTLLLIFSILSVLSSEIRFVSLIRYSINSLHEINSLIVIINSNTNYISTYLLRSLNRVILYLLVLFILSSIFLTLSNRSLVNIYFVLPIFTSNNVFNIFSSVATFILLLMLLTDTVSIYM